MRVDKEYPTQERLRELFKYCDTGNLFRVAGLRRNLDRPAGTLLNTGYIHVHVDGKPYLLHRLIFIYHKANIPENNVVDHVNGDKCDNRIGNLQAISQKNNVTKQKFQSRNTSGYRGVSFNKDRGKWVAQIRANNKRSYIGLFNSPQEAALAYDQAAKKYFGQFAQLNFPDVKSIAAE